MSSNKPSLTSLSSSVHKRVALAMSKGRPGSLSVPTFRFKPNTEEVTTEEAVNEDPSAEDSGRSAASSPPSSPSSVTKLLGPVKKSARTLSLDDSPEEGADSSNWSFLNDIKDKITRTVEENLNRFDSIISSTNKVKAAEPLAMAEAVEATADDSNGEVSVEEAAADVLRDAEDYDQNCEAERDTTETPELRRRKNADGRHSMPSSPMRFSELSKLSPSCSVDETARPVEEEVRAVEVHAAQSTTRSLKSSMRDVLQRLKLAKRYAYVFAALVLYRVCSFPSFVDGFVAGACLTTLLVYAWHRLMRPAQLPQVGPKTPVQTAQETLQDTASNVQKVWMNELLSVAYSPESFHVNQTQSVLVRLDGSTLRVSYTKSRIPKRAMWNEPVFEPAPVYQRMYELKRAELRLLPEGLARKRHWSRRYPIEIRLLDGPSARESGAPPHLAKDDPRTVLLFARTGRAKEEWFRLLRAAAAEGQPRDAEDKTRADLAYSVFMSRLIPSPSREAVGLAAAATETPSDPPSPFVEIPADLSSPAAAATEGPAWLNALLGRCFWDFVREPGWADAVRRKIQRKLSTIRVPSFIEELRLSDIELGTQLPQVGRVSAPTLDRNGLWVDARVAYYGAFRMTLETKLNLMKMKKLATRADDAQQLEATVSTRMSSLYDDAAEETGESSSDDEPGEEGQSAAEEAAGRGSSTTGRKILRIVDSIAQSRYFQQAAEYKYVKKAMEGVSTPLVLTVELVSLDGTLAINIPPPPSDRLWYGFRGNPSLSLVAKPKVGEIELQFSHIVEWIQNKLILELQRILILPNMDDLILPISSSGLTPPKQTGSSDSPGDGTSPTSWPTKDQ